MSRWLRLCCLLTICCVMTCTAAVRAQENLPALEEQAMQAAAQKVAPSVVRIEILGGVEQVDGTLLGSGPTTGLVVSPDGYILSSAFAFAGQPSSILVTLPSGKRASASIVARDESRMLVLLKVAADEPLSVPEAVPRDQWQVGQWTIAVGRTYAGEFPNISVGILSAKNRIWGRALQTDAKISPSNYGGPLVDIRGQVLGILVPLSPQQQGEMAGAEWYDSGIGFAVPLVDILRRLDTMKQGQDLKPGILGVSLKGTDIYTLPATIAACPAKSPAREAGLQVGDTIVELDGQPIQRQAQLRHALGPLVAGDSVSLVVERGEKKERVAVTLTLVEELQPYERPELGILPMRDAPDANQPGVIVRALVPGSAAAQAGLQVGDRITSLGGNEVADADQLREALIAFDPESEVQVLYHRGGESKSATVTLGKQASYVPDSLPSGHTPQDAAGIQRPATGAIDINIPEAANKCLAYIPSNYHPQVPCGLLVWLHAPGSFDKDELLKLWQPLCEANNLILLAPQAADARRWTSTEIEFIRKTIDDVLGSYAVDASRVVLHGYLAGGALAYHVAFGNREICRGVAPVGAPLPLRAGTPVTDPVQPLAIYSCSSSQSKSAEQIEAGQQQLAEKAFPVEVVNLPGPERYLNAGELERLLRWIDALDRI